MAATIEYTATGRRKTAVAQVWLRPGGGDFKINKRTLDNYFPNEVHRMLIKTPLALTETIDRFDIAVSVRGGGSAGQADEIRHGISRALLVFDLELRKKLKAEGLLTRDARQKERKKYGQPGARKRFQFSKR